MTTPSRSTFETMKSTNETTKLGAGAHVDQIGIRYRDTWMVQQTTGPTRLLVGPASRHVELLLSLAEVWERDYFVLYVLLVPRLGNRLAGRYQSPGPLSFDELAAFLRRFSGFLEGDGRHHVWIGSTTGAGTLIYDRHDWIYAYGDVPKYIEVLQAQGFTEGEVVLPVPHTHNYHAKFDAAEDELAAYWEWLRSPLHPADDE
jgi:hypothetical protein